MPISRYLGLRFSRMYFLTSMRFDSKYTKGTKRITNSPTTNAGPVPAINNIIPPIMPVKKNVRIITRNASHQELVEVGFWFSTELTLPKVLHAYRLKGFTVLCIL